MKRSYWLMLWRRFGSLYGDAESPQFDQPAQLESARAASTLGLYQEGHAGDYCREWNALHKPDAKS